MLENKGLRYIESNFRCHLGEIDLVMQHADTLVFVEVRYRKDDKFGGACHSINSKKVEKLRNTANYYIQRHPKWANLPCRFDVVLIQGKLSANETQWLANAF